MTKTIKLSKLQRHTAYIIMLAEAEDKKEYRFTGSCEDGFCWLICKTFGLYTTGFIKDNCGEFGGNFKFFPELMKKQFSYGGRWPQWNTKGWQQRIELLKQCIEETA